MNIQTQIDISGALRKTKALLLTPKATKYQLTDWGTIVTRLAKESARDMKKSGPGRKTGALARGVSFIVRGTEDAGFELLVGTGLELKSQVVYARIQDEGGTITAKRTKYLTIPFPGVKGWARNYADSFVIKSKAGNLIIARDAGHGIQPLFLLKKEVKLPATHWFTKVIQVKTPLLQAMMRPEDIYKIAEKMGGPHA